MQILAEHSVYYEGHTKVVSDRKPWHILAFSVANDQNTPFVNEQVPVDTIIFTECVLKKVNITKFATFDM